MAIKILMPAISEAMTEGVLVSWLIQEGDPVKIGDVIAEVETDKATVEVEAVDAGILGTILISAGTEEVPVGQPIAILLEKGEGASRLKAASANVHSQTHSPSQNLSLSSTDISTLAKSGTERIFASPLARRLAANNGIDLKGISNGSGPEGRIVKLDIEHAIAASTTVVNNDTPAHTPTLTNPPYSEVPNSSVRKVIARRLSASKRDVPHFYLSIDCHIDPLLELRSSLNQIEGADYKISINDFVIRAAALALRKVPNANASWAGEAIRLFNDVDISVAVATPEGLITPIVRKADRKNLVIISKETKELAARAHEGMLMPEEFQGGGFTISNLGMFGVKSFSAIINPPQSCILAVGSVEKRPFVIDSKLAVANVMTCTLSVDHRSVDGVIGAEFLSVFKNHIEDPSTMLLQGN